MTDAEINKMAVETYELGTNMGHTFAKDYNSREYMVLAITACIKGLVNTNNLKPVPGYSGEYFKKLRLTTGYTLRQTEFATGISNSYLSQFENGKINKPSQFVVNALINWYNHGIMIVGEDREKGNLQP